MIKHQKKGYIIVMTMLIIALAVAIVTYIYKRGTVYNPLAQLIAHKEKARMLTMSGLQIALAKLGAPVEKKKAQLVSKIYLYCIKHYSLALIAGSALF